MYFNENKSNTNIDAEFKSNKNLNIDFKKIKPILFITGGIILLAIIIFIIISLINNSNKYTIELLGEEVMTISQNSEYKEPGYIAYDKANNDVTDQVEIINYIDTSVPGEYEVLYSIGKINKVRYVTVTEIIKATYIYLNGNKNMYLEVGEKYTEPGYQVYDSIEQNLTEKVKVTGSVDTSKVGTYQITYSVINSRNETITVKRTVIVVEKGKKPQN